jgi:hypothetical protein
MSRPGQPLAGRTRGDDGLAANAEPGQDVRELAVAVCGLIEVHELKVDVGPGQFDVGLGVQVQQRLV